MTPLSNTSHKNNTSTFPPIPSYQKMTPPYSSPTQGWYSSKTSSQENKILQKFLGPSHAKNAYVQAENIMTSKISAIPQDTTPSSKCSETSPSATTSKNKPSNTPPISSSKPWKFLVQNFGSPSTMMTTNPSTFGSPSLKFPKNESFASKQMTTSGKWEIQAHADLAQKSFTTTANTSKEDLRALQMKTATASQKSGTSSSCNSNNSKTNHESNSPNHPSIQEWDSRESLPSCKENMTTTTPTISNPSWNLSPIPSPSKPTVPPVRPSKSS